MKVSIITINYNNAEGLEKTIRSIVSQDHSDFEHIVIDGNSSDQSVDIIKKYETHLTYWISEPDSGIYNAMNKGIKQAKGEYVLFINSGDIINRQANIQRMIDHISGEDIIYFNLEIADQPNNNSYIKKYPNFLDFKYFAEDTLPHTASFIKKELLVEYGYYSEQMKIASDWAFFMDAVCLLKCSYKYINDHFSIFYTDGISSNGDHRQLLINERNEHIAYAYPLYNTIYCDWMTNKQELYKLKTSVSVRYLKKLGFLKWLKI